MPTLIAPIESAPEIEQFDRAEILSKTQWLRGQIQRKIEWFTTPPAWKDKAVISFDAFCPLLDASDVEHYAALETSVTLLESLLTAGAEIEVLRLQYQDVLTLSEEGIRAVNRPCRKSIWQILAWYKTFEPLREEGLMDASPHTGIDPL